MNYHNIIHESMTNGDGVRTVLFVSGCTHACPGCQNQETWSKESGIPFDDEARAEIFDSLEEKHVSGITLSGGDPMAPYNRAEIMELIRDINSLYPDKTIWLYTGFTKEQLMEQDPVMTRELLSRIDVLVDGEFEIDKLDVNYEWAGSTNQRVLRKEDGFMQNTSAHYEYDQVQGNVNSCSISFGNDEQTVQEENSIEDEEYDEEFDI